MQIRCIKCELVKEKSKEQIQAEFGTAEDTIMPVELLDIYKKKGGRCTDGERHIFVFSNQFVEDIGKLKENIGKNNEVIETDNKLIDTKNKELIEFQKQISDLETKIKSYQEDVEKLKNDITVKMTNNVEMETKFEDITGTKDIKIWE